MSCGFEPHERQARDAALGVIATPKRITLLGGRFVFADDWYRWNRWEGLDFRCGDAVEMSGVQVPAEISA